MVGVGLIYIEIPAEKTSVCVHISPRESEPNVTTLR
jgi:hypothetical protein